MFERFTERARSSVVLAQEEARSFGYAYIGTEHLLLGLLREERGIAARALGRLDVTLGVARQQLESIVSRGEDHDLAQAPFTLRSKKVLELGLREGVANRMLSSLGAGADDVRSEVLRLLGDRPAPGGRRGARPRNFRGGMNFEVQARGVDRRGQGPQPILMRLEYSYQAQKAGDTFSEAVDHGKLRRGVASIFEDEAFPFLEPGVVRAEDYVKDEHAAIEETTVSVTIQGDPEVTVCITFEQ